MGAFHEGHLSLMRRARKECDVVVVSLFVNPTQFGDAKDLQAYPRDEKRDVKLARAAGVDLLFAPAVDEMYPAGFGATVDVTGSVAERLEGQARGAAHFRGVATVVTKLLNTVAPDRAYFGQKDAQQVAVVRQLVGGLNVPVKIVVGETVREGDGLAMSSRNVRLGVRERRRAVSMHAALAAVAAAVANGERNVATLEKLGYWKLDLDRVDYFEIVGPEDFRRVTDVDRGVLAVVAGWVGGVRLIDNMPLHASHRINTRRV